MSPVWSEFIDSLLSQGTYLGDNGVRNWALDQRAALSVLSEFSAAGVGVLGGDVYLSKQGRISPTVDGWHCDPYPGEASASFVLRSGREAREYVSRYPHGTGKVLFAIVPRVVA